MNHRIGFGMLGLILSIMTIAILVAITYRNLGGRGSGSTPSVQDGIDTLNYAKDAVEGVTKQNTNYGELINEINAKE